MSSSKEKCTESNSRDSKQNQKKLDKASLNFTSTSFSHTTSPKINMFGVPSILSHTTSIISQDGHKDYVFTFMHEEKKQSAVLKPTFLTALQKDGLTISWEEGKRTLKAGCQVKIDVTQSKPAFFKRNWLVFGLYLGEMISQSSKKDRISPGVQQRRLSKEFEWMKQIGNCTSSDLDSFSKEEKQMANVEDSVFVFSTELDSASKALVTVREDLDYCIMGDGSSECLSPSKLNSTFTLPDGHICAHKYEVGVVVISVEDQFMHMVGPLNDTWLRVVVNTTDTPVFGRGGEKMKNCGEAKIGEIGILVCRKCVHCQVEDSRDSLTTPLMVWFGDGNSPGLRKSPGVVVWVEEDKFLVELDEGGLVIFIEEENIPVKGCRLQAWAWRKTGRCAVGGAWVKRDDAGGKHDLSLACGKQNGPLESLELSASGIFSPIRDTYEQYENSSPNKTFSNKSSSDISFGSISDCDEVDLNKSFNTNLSMLIDSTSPTAKVLSHQENYFQSLFSCTISSLPSGVDLNHQFEQVLADNCMVESYNDLARKYEKYFIGRNLPRTDFGSALIDKVEKVIDYSLSSRICVESSPELSKRDHLMMKKSCPSLSPIPEESIDTCQDTSVFFTPVGKISEDSGYFDSFSAGSSFKPSKLLSFSDENSSGFPPKQPGPEVVLEKPCHNNVLEQHGVHKNVLEQFLEFTQFPDDKRSEIVELFMASH